MTERSLEQETVSPLLLELARALRARQFYPRHHPALQDTLERATAVWRDGLRGVQELELALRSGSLMLPDGTPARGPGIDDLARALRLRRVQRLRIHRDLEAAELLALIDVLARTVERLEDSDGLEEALLRAGVRHITTSEIDFAQHFARIRARAQAARVEDSGREPDDDARRASSETLPRANPPVEAPPAAPPAAPAPPEPLPASLASPEKLRSEAISELIQLLAELEKCDEVSEYQELAQQILERVSAMTEARNVSDGYRAVLVCCRHATDVGARTQELRVEARRWLQLLVDSPGLLDLVVDHGCAGAGLSSVQATQALICLGSSVVPTLLACYERGNTVVQSQITGVLIAMGDTAFPVMLEELASDSTDRASRAARLLGRMQNPRAADALLEKLHEPDEELAQEAARALARIGTNHAVRGLLRAAKQLPELTSVVTTCLGETRSPAAVHALAQILDPSQRYPEHQQREAIRSLGRIRNPDALGALERVLARRTFFRRRRTRMLCIAAARAIGRIGGEDASRLLEEHAQQGDPAVQKACLESLQRMSRAEAR